MSKELPSWLKSLYPFESKYFELLGGDRMHYVDEGSGEAVLMVHGNPSWSFLYRNVILNLKDRFRCIAMDHIGMGLSDKPQNYNYCLESHIANLKALINCLQLKEFHLIVHDWGGLIGIGAALQSGAKVKSLTILNTAAFNLPNLPISLHLCRVPKLGEFLIRQLNVFAQGTAHWGVRYRMPKNIRKGFLYPYQNYNDRIGIARFVADIPVSNEYASFGLLLKIESQLHEYHSIPKQILWGASDPCFTKPFYDHWRHVYPDAETEYYHQAGHYVLEDTGDLIIQRIRKFLKNL